MVEQKLAESTSLVFGALKAVVFHPISQVPATPATEYIPQYASLQAVSYSLPQIQPSSWQLLT